jgi:hypothetical protein
MSEEAQQQPPRGVVAMVKFGYRQLVNAIVRPPRARYALSELPMDAVVGRVRVVRCDFVVTNARGMKLQCSHWAPECARLSRGRLLGCV